MSKRCNLFTWSDLAWFIIALWLIRLNTSVQAQETTLHKRKLNISSDGHFIATSFSDSSVQIQDVPMGLVTTYAAPAETLGLDLNDIQFSPDSTKLAISFGDPIAGSAGYIFILNVPNADLSTRIPLISYAGSLAWQPDGSHLAVTTARGMAGSLEEYELMVWDTSDWSLIEDIQLPNPSVSFLSWSPHGDALAVANGNIIQLYDTTSWQVSQTLVGHSDYIRSIDWDSDGKQLVSSSTDQSIRIWDTLSGNTLRSFTRKIQADFTNTIFWVGQDIATFGENGIEIWDATSGENKTSIIPKAPEWIKYAAKGSDKMLYLDGESEQVTEIPLPLS